MGKKDEKKAKEPTKEEIKAKKEKVFKELLSKCKSQDDNTSKRENNIIKAVRTNYLATIEAQTQFKTHSEIHLASLRGDAEKVTQLLREDKSRIGAIDEVGNTPLMYACENGQFDTAVLLIEYNTDINQQSKHGYTALMFACWKGHNDIVSLLIRHNVDVKKANLNGDTALHFAAMCGHHLVCLMLRRASADTSVKNKKKKTPTDNMKKFIEELQISMSEREHKEIEFELSHKRFGIQNVANEYFEYMEKTH